MKGYWMFRRYQVLRNSRMEYKILVQGQSGKFIIDTGTDETVLSQAAFKMLKRQPPLTEAARQL